MAVRVKADDRVVKGVIAGVKDEEDNVALLDSIMVQSLCTDGWKLSGVTGRGQLKAMANEK